MGLDCLQNAIPLVSWKTPLAGLTLFNLVQAGHKVNSLLLRVLLKI